MIPVLKGMVLVLGITAAAMAEAMKLQKMKLIAMNTLQGEKEAKMEMNQSLMILILIQVSVFRNPRQVTLIDSFWKWREEEGRGITCIL